MLVEAEQIAERADIAIFSARRQFGSTLATLVLAKVVVVA